MMHDIKLVHGAHDALHQPCLPVNEALYDTPALIDLASEMVHALPEWDAVGLAAPQIGETMRLFVVAESVIPGQVVVNPTLHRSGKKAMAPEGCLSIPGRDLQVMRHSCVNWSARDQYGNPIQGQLHAHGARVFQHEFDHLEGLLIEDVWVGRGKIKV